jgi:putative copper export protein
MIRQLIQFAGYFLAIGSVGFRFGVVRQTLSDEARRILRPEKATLVGMLGIFLLALSLIGGLYAEAFKRQVVVSELLPTAKMAQFEFKLGMFALAMVGFRLVPKRTLLGWTIAGIAIVSLVLQPLYTGKLAGKVNAVHILAASTWLGTLLVLTLIGVHGVAKSGAGGVQRTELIRDLVNSFSPIALTAATIVAITGVTTAWLHLKRVSALYTTSYGIALIVKLVLVAIVVALGVWNWKRVRPSLGNEGSDLTIRRSATMELAVAALVLIATSVLVTLPSPK